MRREILQRERHLSMDFILEQCDARDISGWLALRAALWPDTPASEHIEEMAAFVTQPERYFQLLARNTEGVAIGLIEASIRTDYVNGTASSPVGYLEGIYVIPEARTQGVARQLLDSAMKWATLRGCREFASDAQLNNALGHEFHRALGFVETDRVVCFVQLLDPEAI
jgi:aminoglycoside 6'-N-acetyltransferase I